MLTEAELREGLSACLAVPRWVDDVVAAAPFFSLAELLEAARHAGTPLTEAEIDQALSHHPRIGERVIGQGTAESFSRVEQASSASDDETLAENLAAGNRAYEERFGRVFLIRAAGRSGAEILAELRRRTELEPAMELAKVGSELLDIALLRIKQLFRQLDHHSGYDEDEAAR